MPMQPLRVRAFAIVAGVAVLAFSGWASADPPSRVARLGYMTGAVSFSPAGENDWVQATINRPLTTGDRLWADAGARAEIQVGGAMIRMDASTGVSVLNLDDHIAQLQLTQGTLNVRVRRLASRCSRSIRRISPLPFGNPPNTGSKRNAALLPRFGLGQRGTDDESIPQQFGYRVQLLHMLRHDFDDDDDGNAEQHSPDAPQPTPEQQRYEHGR
jgi:hypothetical protein